VPQLDQGLPKHKRLRKRSEFQQVYQEGLRVPGRLFTLFYRQIASAEPGRFGLTVSRKVGGAVVRNRVKRLLRESIRHSWELFPAGSEVVFHARNIMRDTDLATVQSEVERGLDKAARRSGGKGSA
jgi:ribonuclease P protein component